MEVYYLPKFGRDYKKLPPEIKAVAKEREQIFRSNPFDPRLKTHKLHGDLEGFWAFSVTHSYRIIFAFVSADSVRFYSVGNHDIYE